MRVSACVTSPSAMFVYKRIDMCMHTHVDRTQLRRPCCYIIGFVFGIGAARGCFVLYFHWQRTCTIQHTHIHGLVVACLFVSLLRVRATCSYGNQEDTVVASMRCYDAIFSSNWTFPVQWTEMVRLQRTFSNLSDGYVSCIGHHLTFDVGPKVIRVQYRRVYDTNIKCIMYTLQCAQLPHFMSFIVYMRNTFLLWMGSLSVYITFVLHSSSFCLYMYRCGVHTDKKWSTFNIIQQYAVGCWQVLRCMPHSSKRIDNIFISSQLLNQIARCLSHSNSCFASERVYRRICTRFQCSSGVILVFIFLVRAHVYIFSCMANEKQPLRCQWTVHFFAFYGLCILL